MELAQRPEQLFRSNAAFYAPSNDASGAIVRAARILIVEDDYLVALELENRLIEAGYEVVGIAGSAEEALQIAASKKPDLAVMDIRLTGTRDGVDAAIELRSEFGVPSIFATAHADALTRQRAERALAVGWLQKPYSAEKLVDLVNAALSSDESGQSSIG